MSAEDPQALPPPPPQQWQQQPQQQWQSPQPPTPVVMHPSMMAPGGGAVMAPPVAMVVPGMGVDRCRGNAKCVGICDLVCTSLMLVFLLILMGLAIVGLTSKKFPKEVNNIFFVLIAACVITGIMAIIDLVICCGLLTACDPATPAQEAASKAGCWLCYNIFFLIFSFIFGGTVSYGATTVTLNGVEAVHGSWLILLVRILFIIIVCQYKSDLEMYGGRGLMASPGMAMMQAGQGQQPLVMTSTPPAAAATYSNTSFGGGAQAQAPQQQQWQHTQPQQWQQPQQQQWQQQQWQQPQPQQQQAQPQAPAQPANPFVR